MKTLTIPPLPSRESQLRKKRKRAIERSVRKAQKYGSREHAPVRFEA